MPACRYTQHVTLSNTGAIPLTFSWRVADEAGGNSGAARNFSALPASGTVLPHASQVVAVEFQPQHVQQYALSLLLDLPGVTEGAARIALRGECAVPIIRVANGDHLLQFGEVFLRHAYTQQCTLINDSKLPAKFEVLPQVGGRARRR